MSETKTKDRAATEERIEAPARGELERYDPAAAIRDGHAPIYDRINAQMLGVLKAKWRNLNDQEVAQALEMAISLGLNPWTNEIYAGKGQGQDGNSGNLLIMVGRDGLLRKAEEFPDYRGYDAGVVYENDHFEKGEPDPDAKTMRARAGVVHRQGHPKDRGAIVGAWAVAERRGRPTRYFYADWEEYAPPPNSKKPWNKNKSVMMEKVPISVVHRTLINLSGVYLEEEVQAVLEGTAVDITPTDGGDLPWGDGPEGERLRTAWERVHESCPADVYPRAKMELVLPGLTDEQRLVLTEELEAIAEKAEAENAAEMERSMAAEAGAAEEPPDAEVVEDDGKTPEGRAAEQMADSPTLKAAEEDAAKRIAAERAEKDAADEERPYKDKDPAQLREMLEEARGDLATAESDESFPDDPDDIREQIEQIETELRRQGGEDPDQGALL